MKRFALIVFSCAWPAIAFGQTANAPAFLTLAGAEKIALQYHPQIKQADYLALAAQEAVKESRSGFFPTVNLYADAVGVTSQGARITAGGLNNPSVYDRGAVGGQLNQLITDFGRTANLTASSKYQARAQDQTANATREQVLLQVDAGYFDALEAQAVLRVAQQTVDTRKQLLDQITALATNKLRSELDVSFARVELQQARLLVEKSQNDAAAAMAMLSTALGYGEFHEFKLADESPATNDIGTDVSGMVQTALSRRPELLSLRDDREAALRFARSQRDSRLPTVSAIGVAGAAPIRDDRYLKSDYFAGGIQFSVPLFAGGLYVSRQRQAELKADADAELLRSVENNVIRDVRIAWLDLNDAVQQLDTTEQLAANSADAFTLAQARYKSGLSSIVELSDAQLNLTQSQITEANARYNVLIQQANLNYQMGTIQ
ncbi:MAG TPA: TolC family protein [Verrucomicrobiae bacterium]|jgi:outer membrane protein|nr:TolC family protein [Verrucomicrobiae bacterium]